MVRIKHRYLLVNVLYPDEKPSQTKHSLPYTVQFRQPSPDALDSRFLTRLIRDAVAHFFGDYGAGMTAGSLQLKYLSAPTSTAIIRVSREHYRMIWAALTLITRLPPPVNLPCMIQVVRVSGTIKKAEEEAILRAKQSIRQARKANQLQHPLSAREISKEIPKKAVATSQPDSSNAAAASEALEDAHSQNG